MGGYASAHALMAYVITVQLHVRAVLPLRITSVDSITTEVRFTIFIMYSLLTSLRDSIILFNR